MRRARARAAIATVNFADRTDGVRVRRGSVARAAPGGSIGPSLPVQSDDYVQCNPTITCKPDTAASHIAGLDVPYRVIRQAGPPQATNQVPSAREDLGQGRRHPGRSDGEDGVEWRVVMPLGGEANAPM
jgi:hypothetical protein